MSYIHHAACGSAPSRSLINDFLSTPCLPLPGSEQKHHITGGLGLSAPPETRSLPNLSRTPTLALDTCVEFGISALHSSPLEREIVSLLIKDPVPVDWVLMRK